MIPARQPHTSGVGRREFFLVLTLVFVGGLFRGFQFHRLGLSHFDEGVYALSGLWSVAAPGHSGFYVGQVFYAPPLFPILIGLQYRLLGPSDLAAILPSLIAGMATVPMVWWVARRWYGPAAGAATALIAALNGFHVLYSRMALTDALFGLTVLLTVWLAWEAGCWSSGSRPWWVLAIGLGLAGGAAMNTKYNGSLALAAGGLGGFLGALSIPAARPGDRLKRLGTLLVGLVLGSLCYLPWFRHVQAEVGYAALVHHQLGYARSSPGWFANLGRQLSNLAATDGWSSGLGLVAALALARAVSGGPIRWKALCLDLVQLLIGVLLLGAEPVMIILALLAVVRSIGKPNWAHLVWLLLFGLTIPIYVAYPRLWLPLEIAIWIGAGAALAGPCHPWSTDSVRSQRRFLAAVLIPIGALGLGLILLVEFGGRWLPADQWRALAQFRYRWTSLRIDSEHLIPGPWTPTDRLRGAVLKVMDQTPSDSIYLVRGLPPVTYYLAFDRAVQPVERDLLPADLRSNPRPIILVIDSASLTEPAVRSYLRRHRAELGRVGKVAFPPSLGTLLDAETVWDILDASVHPVSKLDILVWQRRAGGGRVARP